MRRNKKTAPRLRKTMLGCFTAILVLFGLLIEEEIVQPESPSASTLALPDEAKPRPIDPQIDGY